MPDTNTVANAEKLTGFGALLAMVPKIWSRLTGTAVLKATVHGHTLALAEQATQMRELGSQVTKVREDLARIPTKEDLTGAVRDLTAALVHMADRQTEALVNVHKRLDAHLEHHPKD